jgi:hypothetical protein
MSRNTNSFVDVLITLDDLMRYFPLKTVLFAYSGKVEAAAEFRVPVMPVSLVASAVSGVSEKVESVDMNRSFPSAGRTFVVSVGTFFETVRVLDS